MKCYDLGHLKYLITHRSWWETIDWLDAAVGEIVLKNPELNEVISKWSIDENI